MVKTLLASILYCSVLATSVWAQPIPGDGLVGPWPTGTPQSWANYTSDVTVATSLAADTWTSWHASNRKAAFTCQAIRTGIILGVSEGLKHLVHQERPDGSDRYSFPSEHSAFAMSALGGPRWELVVPLAVGTGYLRVAADRHYWLSDVVPGLVLGAVVGHFTRSC